MINKICPICGKEFPEKKFKSTCCSRFCGRQYCLKIHPEQGLKISLAKKGKKRAPFSEEWKKHLGEKSIGNTYRRGKVMSVESRKKISDSAKGRPSKLKGRTFVEMFGKENALEMVALKTSGFDRDRKGKSYEEIFGKEKAIIIKQKLRDANLGKKLSKECMDKMAITKKNHPPSQDARWRMGSSMRGKHISEKHRQILIESKKALWKNPLFVEKIMNSPSRMCNTKPELKMKAILDFLKFKYIHGYLVKDIEHQYIADFYLPDFQCIVEVDGKYWHNYPKGREIDHIRTNELNNADYYVLRFWEGEIFYQSVTHSICELIINNPEIMLIEDCKSGKVS